MNSRVFVQMDVKLQPQMNNFQVASSKEPDYDSQENFHQYCNRPSRYKNLLQVNFAVKSSEVVKAVKTRYGKSATKTREAKILSKFNLLLLFLLFLFCQGKVFFCLLGTI